jgi:TPP-dependent pyruvate/acetoin dehydrogenase alpha subunit
MGVGAPAEAPVFEIWKTAATIRIADEALRRLASSGKFQGFYYSPRGQEVVAATLGACLRRDDWLVTTYRGLHDQIAKGIGLPELFGELFGKRTGCCGGKGGPMHVADPEAGVMVTTGIVGSGLPIAVGLGLAAQMEGGDRVAVASFGDGATNIGAFHEAMNLAAVWQLPVVFVCQNNEFAEFTPRTETQPVEVWTRGAAYGMPSAYADDSDVDRLFTVLSEAVGRARAGEGPTLVEARTYRFMGHFFGDPMVYMDADERATRAAADPVDVLRSRLARDGRSEADLQLVESEVAGAVEAALEAAQNAPDPDPSEVFDDVVAAV